MINLKEQEIWFVVGSQLLYGEEVFEYRGKTRSGNGGVYQCKREHSLQVYL